MKQMFLLSAVLFLLAGCECFLPGGKAPEGNIITHTAGDDAAEIILDYSGAVDYFINELIRETMLHSPGMNIFVDADSTSQTAVNHIIRKTGEFSGIAPAGSGKGNLHLVSRRTQKSQWQMKLVTADGKPLWMRTVILKAN